MSSANFGRKLSPNVGKVWNDVSVREPRTPPWLKRRISAAYPVIACIVGALYWSTYVGGKYLVTSPDVFWSRDQRSNAIVREDTHEAENWGKRHKSWSIEKDQLKDLRVGYAPARAEPRA
ncbi:unnamed protein product [Symbiodinium sp. KB8]|nr:unnamed protein product [Symbiodinium sp. KB8]